jgi:Glycosyltransferase family 87
MSAHGLGSDVAYRLRPTLRSSVCFLATLALLGIWLHRVSILYRDGGLFRVLGIDWSLYAAQALLVRAGQTQVMYDLDHIDATLQSFVVYTTNPAEPLAAGPVVYPPLFAWLNIPLTVPSPPVGFELWTALNLVGVAYLAWRAAQVLPGTRWILVFLALLITVPIAQGLIVGQPTVLLACAMAECYLALSRGRDFRAGLWLSLLLLKPQYGLLFAPILIWKQRWTTVAGAALGGLVIVGLSVLVVGPMALLTFPAAMTEYGDFGGGALIAPGLMINWRALILWLRPSIGQENGFLLTSALGALTVVAILPIWRGRWSARSAAFPAQIATTLLATVLVNYHSHVHGAALLAVPLAATLAQRRTSQISQLAILALAFAPTVLIVAGQHWFLGMLVEQRPLDTLIWSPLVQVLLVAAMAGLVLDVARQRQPAAVKLHQLVMRDESNQRPDAGVHVT